MKKKVAVYIVLFAALVCFILALGDWKIKDPLWWEEHLHPEETIAQSGSKVPHMGFLTIGCNGISEHPFSTDADVYVEWEGEKPLFTALPVWVTGELDEDGRLINSTLSLYSYTQGTNAEADAYMYTIESGFQESFEDFMGVMYEDLNGGAFKELDSTFIADFLADIHGKTEYGYMQDVLTDAVVLAKEINEHTESEDANTKASDIYNGFYSCLYNFSVYSLGNND